VIALAAAGAMHIEHEIGLPVQPERPSQVLEMGWPYAPELHRQVKVLVALHDGVIALGALGGTQGEHVDEPKDPLAETDQLPSQEYR
jgi:hypothetical protein